MEDAPYLDWLNRVRQLCVGSEASRIESRCELEASTSKALMACCCERWSRLSWLRSHPSIFDGTHPPRFSIQKYGSHISRYLDLSPAAVIGACIYILRLLRADKQLRLSVPNVHRLLITALLLSAKFFDDG